MRSLARNVLPTWDAFYATKRLSRSPDDYIMTVKRFHLDIKHNTWFYLFSKSTEFVLNNNGFMRLAGASLRIY